MAVPLERPILSAVDSGFNAGLGTDMTRGHGMQTMNELADAFFDAFIRRDVRVLETLYDPEFRLFAPWGEATGAEHLELLRSDKIDVKDLVYHDVRREFFADGFLQEHVGHGVLPSGIVFRLRTAVVVKVRNGKLVRMDEYFDPTSISEDPHYQELRRTSAPAGDR
jgi:ketosteroid isomerase-like protein